MNDGTYKIHVTFTGHGENHSQVLDLVVKEDIYSIIWKHDVPGHPPGEMKINIERNLIGLCESEEANYIVKTPILDPRMTYISGKNPLNHQKPIITEKIPTGRIVAVGNNLVFARKNQTFSDFLHDYLMALMGAEWLEKERRIVNIDKMSPISFLLRNFDNEVAAARTQSQGRTTILHVGAIGAILNLANSLYVLQHNKGLQTSLIKRLKCRHNFQGAFYEAMVCALIVSANYEIEYEDESDRRTKHPEIYATHRPSGQRIAVEAKCKHNNKLFIPNSDKKFKNPFRLGTLLNQAFAKKPDCPYIVFLELNLPAELIPTGETIPRKILNCLRPILPAPTPENPDPFNLLVITNRPFFYSIEAPELYRESMWNLLSTYPQFPLNDPSAIHDILNAVDKIGVMHNDFDGSAIKRYPIDNINESNLGRTSG